MSALKRLFRRPVGAVDAISSISRTHVGRVRAINEDRVLDRTDLRLWAVADGMGGHQAGDVAAEFVIGELTRWGEHRGTESLSEAMLRAHRQLREVTGGNGGTTLVAMVARENDVQICWAGDSRAYLIRAGRLRQLTRDHSVVQQLLDAGLIDEAESRSHPHASVITSALGTNALPLIESSTIPISSGDRVLLCSDGLSRSLGEDDAMGELPPAVLADRMMAAAIERDGSDNVSLVLIQFP